MEMLVETQLDLHQLPQDQAAAPVVPVGLQVWLGLEVGHYCLVEQEGQVFMHMVQEIQ